MPGYLNLFKDRNFLNNQNYVKSSKNRLYHILNFINSGKYFLFYRGELKDGFIKNDKKGNIINKFIFSIILNIFIYLGIFFFIANVLEDGFLLIIGVVLSLPYIASRTLGYISTFTELSAKNKRIKFYYDNKRIIYRVISRLSIFMEKLDEKYIKYKK